MTAARHGIPRAAGILLLALLVTTGTATACVINNKASLFANGVQATLNPAAPPSNGAALWARFTLDKAFASASPIHFGELRADLQRSLAPSTLAAPYRWEFGDGAVSLGHTVAHRYTRAGLYRLTVYGYAKSTHSWFPFDNALVRIVPPGQLLQANLGYYALRALDVVMSGFMWVLDALLVGLVLYIVVSQRRRRKAPPAVLSKR